MKQHTNKQHRTPINILLYIVLVWLAAITVFIAWSHVSLNSLLVDEGRNQTYNQMTSSTYKTPIFDVAENRAYLPELKAFLPLTNISRDLRYKDHSDGLVTFSTAKLIGTYQVANDRAEPTTCTILAKLTAKSEESAPITDTSPYVYVNIGILDKPLANKSLYLYRQDGCRSSQGSPYNADAIAQELLKLERY